MKPMEHRHRPGIPMSDKAKAEHEKVFTDMEDAINDLYESDKKEKKHVKKTV